MAFRTAKTIYPGQAGSKKWMQKYGDDLLCIRYKYDAENREKIKTVELLAEKQEWRIEKRKIPHNKTVRLKVAYGEKNIGRLVRAAGGTWNREERVWELPYGEVLALDLVDRIVESKSV